jgi:hypothetical protein
MQPLSRCVSSTHHAGRRASGNTLIIVLGAILVFALIGSALFEVTDTSRLRALQGRERDRAMANVEFDLQAIRHEVSAQLEQESVLTVESLSLNQTQEQPSTGTGYYKLEIQAQADGPRIYATQTHDTPVALVNPYDPFRGAAAVVDSFTVTGNAQSTLPSGIDSRFDLPTITYTPQMSIRQIPLSEFTLFSSTTASLQMAAPATPVVGRIHTEGDLVISGGTLDSLYPVTAGGNISLGANGSLFAQSAPHEAAFAFPVASTSDNNWLAMARSIGRSTILSGRDLPMHMMQAADVNQMVAPAVNTAANTPLAQQQLWRQCNRIVMEDSGKISATAPDGSQCNSQEQQAYYSYYSRHYQAGIVIVVNLSKVTPQTGRNSFYVGSTQTNRVVLLIGANNIPANLSIISSLPVAIEGGLNVAGAPQAVAITAPSVFGVPAGW